MTTKEDFEGTSRFAVIRRLGAGGAGVVYEALDRELGARVALKRLKQRLWPEAILRFKSEFRALENVDHPNLVGLGELFEEDGHWFFTMELIDGVDFFTWVRTSEPEPPATERAPPPSSIRSDMTTDPERTTVDPRAAAIPGGSPRKRAGGFDEDRLRDALVQLLAGLDALHSAGKVHRDVKPSNVMVATGGRVVLLDFGLAVDAILGTPAPASAAASRAEGIVGTISYMAPEQAMGVRVDARADMYSVGVVLYRALTGRLPYTSPPPLGAPFTISRPREVVPEVPPDLDALCMELLDLDLSKRPSARDAIARIAGTSRPDLPRHDTLHPGALGDGRRERRFFGRELELAQLSEAFDRTLRGECAVVFVTGESGLGKTTLVRRFGETIAREYGAIVLASRCYERESVPYKAVDGIADVLARWLAQLPPEDLHALVPIHAARLGEVFPSLRTTLLASDEAAGSFPPPRDPREHRAQLFSAVRDLFGKLAARLPVVLVIDDLQWGGADSLALLHEALRPPEAPSVLLIATMRDHPKEMESAIREDARVIALGPLEKRDAHELAREALHGLHHGRMIDDIVVEGGGHPLFIETLARGVLARTEDTLRSPRLDDTLARAVGRLDAPSRDVVEAVCVAAAPLRVDVVLAAVSTQGAAPPDRTARVVRGLQVARLVRTRGSGHARTIEAYHDRIRHAVAERLSHDERRAWHARIGEALERVDPDNAEAMASHFLAAGSAHEHRRKAARWLAVSAENAFRVLAFDRAATLLRELLALGVLDREEARASRTRLGEVLAHAGHGAEAANAYLAAAGGASPDVALDLKRRAAEQLLISGHIDRGLETLDPVLEAAGSSTPKTRAAAAASFAWGRARLTVRGLAFVERAEPTVKPELLRRVDAFGAAAAALGMVDTIRGADFQTRHLLAALEVGEPRRLVRALSLEAAFSASTGTRARDRTASLLELAGRVATRVPEHPMSRVLPLTGHGFSAFLEGRWADARVHLEKADAILRTECSGAGMAYALVNTSLYSLGALIHLGCLDEIAERLPAILDDALQRNDRYALTQLRAGVAAFLAIAHDDLDEARREARAAMDGWARAYRSSDRGTHMPNFFDVLARVQIDLHSGNPAAAHARTEEGARTLRRAMLLRVQFVRVKMTELRARTALALSLQDAKERASLLTSFDRDVASLFEEGAAWATTLAELAVAAREAAFGMPDEASRRFAVAAASADACHMALHAAVARSRMGGNEGDHAERWLRAQGVGDPKRFVRTLSPS